MRKNKFHCLPLLVPSGQTATTPAYLEPIDLKENSSVITQRYNYVYYINECNRILFYGVNGCKPSGNSVA
jgi:hypothetical protein